MSGRLGEVDAGFFLPGLEPGEDERDADQERGDPVLHVVMS
jgi:hypothetical protein